MFVVFSTSRTWAIITIRVEVSIGRNIAQMQYFASTRQRGQRTTY